MRHLEGTVVASRVVDAGEVRQATAAEVTVAASSTAAVA